jgi:tRNA-dihydrouridine synthase
MHGLRASVLKIIATVPPVCYEAVYDLAQQFPDSVFVLNGGLADHAQALHAIGSLDGVMFGRAAYQPAGPLGRGRPNLV